MGEESGLVVGRRGVRRLRGSPVCTGRVGWGEASSAGFMDWR
jgi:hypothetical protein